MNFGDYCKVRISTPQWKDTIPGQCAKVDKFWYVIADQTRAGLEFVVNQGKWLTQQENFDVEFPLGPGFPHLDDYRLHLIAGGTGIGAMIPVITYRLSRGLPTAFRYCGKNVDEASLYECFPILRYVDFSFWNTSEGVRPSIRHDLLPQDVECKVLFAGPKSFHSDICAVGTNHQIFLNF